MYSMAKQISNKKKTGNTMIRASWKLCNYLDENGLRGESYEDIIWRLLGQKVLTKEQKKGIRNKYEEEL